MLDAVPYTRDLSMRCRLLLELGFRFHQALRLQQSVKTVQAQAHSNFNWIYPSYLLSMPWSSEPVMVFDFEISTPLV